MTGGQPQRVPASACLPSFPPCHAYSGQSTPYSVCTTTQGDDATDRTWGFNPLNIPTNEQHISCNEYMFSPEFASRLRNVNEVKEDHIHNKAKLMISGGGSNGISFHSPPYSAQRCLHPQRSGSSTYSVALRSSRAGWVAAGHCGVKWSKLLGSCFDQLMPPSGT